MKLKITLLIYILTFVTNNYDVFAQEVNFSPVGDEYQFNRSKTPCLTNSQREVIKAELINNVRQLQQENRLAPISLRGAHPLFIWPVQKAAGVTYNDVWSISNYVDHNSAYPNQLQDYNCGTKTYDTSSGYNHQGIDIFTWPFTWKMVDDNSVEIIAAAPGQIIAKGDGQFDRSCGFNNNPWNAVYVRHGDGSVAWYGHMKNGSLTTKNVGDFVNLGEYLGIVGSSGNSTGPHLHFEVYQNDTYTNLIDPYTGACNSLNVDTWWQTQKPYTNPNINAVLTHSAPPVFPTCPNSETTNTSNTFDASATIYFAIYMRDQANGTSINLKIIRPDNSVLYNWNYNFTANYAASYWYWYYSGVYNMNGQWKWEATYNGQTITHTFNVSGALGIDDEDFNTTSVYPNPFNDAVTISSNSFIKKATVVDILGKTVKTIESQSENITEVNLETVSNGLYFLTLESDAGQKKTIKLIKD